MPVVAIASLVNATPEEVWARVSTMRGVNEELAPWLRMSFPAEAGEHRLGPEDTGRVLFTSTLKLFGVVPYDRHALRLVRVIEPEGFVEESTSWTMRAWRHERVLEAAEGGTRVIDRLRFEPRIAATAPLVERLVRAVFKHRHAVLRQQLGGRLEAV